MITSPNSNDRSNPNPAPSLFDAWLQTRLQCLYDKALNEAVPDDLLQLLPDPGKCCGH